MCIAECCDVLAALASPLKQMFDARIQSGIVWMFKCVRTVESSIWDVWAQGVNGNTLPQRA